MSAMSAWDQIPVIDKQWLASAGYHRQPACDGPVLIVATSGSTATQVLVPVTAECANRGLGAGAPPPRMASATAGIQRAARTSSTPLNPW